MTRNAHMERGWAASALLLTLSACGGGGGSGGGFGYPQGADPPASPAAAAHFLQQASFGVKQEDIDALSYLGYAQWFDDQRTQSASLERAWIEAREANGEDLYQDRRLEIWWENAIEGDDQLRQRVAWAFSQIFVISDVSGVLTFDPIGMGEYYDLLTRGCLGNWRELLESVTLSPAMGTYLSMLKNRKADPLLNIRPDENYAREVMQLFSIGLWQLAPDGSRVLDGFGDPIPTYDQTVVEELARVFTGWNYNGATNWDFPEPNYLPMTNWPEYHDSGSKTILDGVALAAGQTGEADLEQALDTIFNHQNVGPFVCQQLIQRLVTSNPSPAYVGRIAAVFADDGTGERGDLYEVVKAILMDDEAREGALTSPDTFGKVREPLLLIAQLWRAFDAKPEDGRYRYWNPERELSQAPLRAPTVFNFYSPFYQPPGELADAGLFAPELQLSTHSQVISSANEIYERVFHSYVGYPTSNDRIVRINLKDQRALAGDPAALVDNLDLLLMGGSMSDEMRTIVIDHVTGTALDDDGTQRVIEAIYLIVTSPEGLVQK